MKILQKMPFSSGAIVIKIKVRDRGLRVQSFRGSKVHGSEVQVSGVQGSKVQRFSGSWFKSS